MSVTSSFDPHLDEPEAPIYAARKKMSVADVENSLLLGGILTVVIVFLFLNSWRSTVITGLTLPISVISSFIVMYFLGMTLNTLTLMALSLAIGLLIDDAIVVRENIVRHVQMGKGAYQAALDAGLRPGGPIEDARWAFGDWGIAVEGIFTGFAWGRNLHRYDPNLEPDVAYMHRYRMSAIFPVETSTGLLAGEILYAGEVLALAPSTEAERARIYSEH